MAGDPFGLLMRQRIVFLGGEVWAASWRNRALVLALAFSGTCIRLPLPGCLTLPLLLLVHFAG